MMNAQTQNPTQPETQRDRNMQILRDFFRLEEEKELDTWLGYWHEDAEQLIPYAPEGFPNSVKGKAELERVYRDLFAGYGRLAFPYFQIYPMLDPEQFVVEWSVEIELLTTGGIYKNNLIGLFTLREGKVLQLKEYFNPNNFLNAIASRCRECGNCTPYER